MASSPAPPGHHDERHESTSSSADDDEITAAAEASPEQGGGGGGGRGTGGSGSAATEGDQKGKGKVVEGSQEAAKKDKVDSQLKKFIRRSFLAVSEGFKKKLSDRQGKQLDEASTSNSPPHVDHKKIPMEEAVYHYFGDIHNVLRLSKRERESVIIMRLVPLHSHYSALRPVYRDGESFYRSFIFSYLEQIVDRVDMGEEDRLLAAVRELARRAEHFQWASEFPRRREEMQCFTILALHHTLTPSSQTSYVSHACSCQIIDGQRSAFEKLIEKIKGWKRMLQYPTLRVRFLKRYNRGEFLLEFFSSYDTTDDIFAFLRLAAAIWMCSPDHITMYAPGVIGPGEGRSLEDWCSTQVIPPRVYADEVAVRALAAALQVFIRVEAPEYGGRQDSYYIARDRPRVTLLRMDSQYDIVYPLSPELIHQRAKRGGASRFYCCIGGDSNLQRLSQQQEERGGGGQ
ncbi:OVARIAN TUMOR DOMAIN-containing deubiquitinating enzyme 1 [Oryza sativa Japonica Group]|uniref:OVARIAN TUMOR DOMAIN-containing deubiquitinating enzyme 1 n=1 Tax=Oryza sativa subsp. japonica TaxID=39947 RepID=UPI00339C8462